MSKELTIRLQACEKVLVGLRDKLRDFENGAENFSNIVKKNISDCIFMTELCQGIVGRYKSDRDLRYKDVTDLCHRIGRVVVNVEIVALQISALKKEA